LANKHVPMVNDPTRHNFLDTTTHEAYYPFIARWKKRIHCVSKRHQPIVRFKTGHWK